jgi:toxin HigB-1
MIISYRDRKTGDFANGKFVKAFQAIEKQAGKRLAILDAATSVNDLRNLPSNRFAALHGDRQGQFSIRINRQWRVCFEWPDGAAGPSEVEISKHYGD